MVKVCEKDPVASKGAYVTNVLEKTVPTHVTITEDLLNSMDTNLQSVFFFISFLILYRLVHPFTVPRLGLFDEL